MNLKIRFFIFFMMTAGCFTFCTARSRYLQEAVISGTEEKVVKVVKNLAERIAFEKEQKKQKKLVQVAKRKQEELARKEQKKRAEKERKERIRLVRLKKKSERHEVDLMRKASELEKRRRKRITAWRYYRRNKQSADCLIKEADSVDLANQLHVEELQNEIETFGVERLAGNLGLYPQLEGFLDL